MATRVTLHDLVVDYGSGPVVDGVSLDVEPGSLVALLGPSGCGKSTTLRAVAGLLQPRAGDVRFDGASVLHVAPEKRPVAMVFQSPLLFPHMSIGDNVAFGLRMRGVGKAERRRRAAEALERVQLAGVADRRPGSCRAGRSSACRWPARWSCSRRCCCSTSRSAPSTPRCASRCVSSSPTCSGRPG
jgi:ABC-type Fe3+/spermidine/putrescine transport system ATPase subunit